MFIQKSKAVLKRFSKILQSDKVTVDRLEISPISVRGNIIGKSLADIRLEIQESGMVSVPVTRLQGEGGKTIRFFHHFDEDLRIRKPDEIGLAIIQKSSGRVLERMVFPKLTFSNSLDFISLDVSNNCNLRCPFCVYDYSGTQSTKNMTIELFNKVVPMLAHVNDGVGLWLSCFHEPTMNKSFEEFVRMVPKEYGKKVFFTSNLSIPFKDSLIDALANSGFYYINISCDTLNADLFPQLRRNGKLNIFLDNVEKLSKAVKNSSNPPRLRFITMAFKSNCSEIPAMVERCKNEFGSWEHEVRGMFSMKHISTDFKKAELLNLNQFADLEKELRKIDHDIQIVPQPSEDYYIDADPFYTQWGVEGGAKDENRLPEMIKEASKLQAPLQLRMAWDGTTRVIKRRAEFEIKPDAIHLTENSLSELSNEILLNSHLSH